MALLKGQVTGGANIVNPLSYFIENDAGTYNAYLSGGLISSDTDLDVVIADVQTDIGSDAAIVEFGVGDFFTSAGMNWAKGNKRIKGQGMGVTNIIANVGGALDSTAFFKFDPSQSASAYSLTSSALAGDLTLSVSPSDSTHFAAGDWIILYSTLNIDTEFPGRKQGELHQILSVNTGTGVITLGVTNDGTYVYETFTTGNSAKIAKLTMLENITVSGITFYDLDTSRPNTLGTGQVLFRFCVNVLLEGCQFRDMFHTGVEHWQTVGFKANGNDIKNIKDVTPGANTFYGIATRGASLNTTIENNTFNNMRHATTTNAGSTVYYAGRVRNYSVDGNTSISSTEGHFDTHEGAFGVSITDNTMIGGDDDANGIQVRTPATITGNSIVSAGHNGIGILLFGGAHGGEGAIGSIVSGNQISGFDHGVIVDLGVQAVAISSNSILDCFSGITLSEDTGVMGGDRTSIRANLIKDCQGSGITANSQVDVVVDGNTFDGNDIPITILNDNVDNLKWQITNNKSLNHGTSDDPDLGSSTGTMLSNNYGFAGSQYVTPATGATVKILQEDIIIDPAGALVALTLNLPTDPYPGMPISISCSQAVTTVTLANGTAVGAITTLAAGGFAQYIYRSSTNKWYRKG